MNDSRVFRPVYFVKLLALVALTAGQLAYGNEPEVGWPKSWHETEEVFSVDREVEGVRQLASKIASNGEKEATIELLSLEVQNAQATSLDSQFESVFQTVRSGFEVAGLIPRCTPPFRSRLGGLPSMETNCQIIYDNQILLLQSVAMALGEQRLYSLIYTASPANSVMYRDDYLVTRTSLRLR